MLQYVGAVPMQFHPISGWQVFEQPSEDTALPSSHPSGPDVYEFPQRWHEPSPAPIHTVSASF